ncbi:hypothetical protein FB45DRAFT_958016 [Roridomyces roridus]|uniref:BTB domain-containing protein n=1 Tax=Roridomyces roridus TaxID=1738132 RepID=A0AAD7F671_9AGAR|nr:hypothetical protein FB45DRAFT_958016 [Roridomyces roridus]
MEPETARFRVYRGTLAACSPVFKDMLSFPQPADAELVEGCSVVHLPDAPDEFTVFLKAIFLPDYFMPFPAKTEYAIIRGCLRLSHKYGVEHLHLRALVHFSSLFHTSLAQSDKAEYPYSESTGPLTQAKFSISLMDVIRGNAFNGETFHLSTQDQESFLRGLIQQIQFQPQASWDAFQTPSKSQIVQPLLVQFAAIDILGCFTDPVEIPNCSSAVRCLKGRLSAVNTVHQAASDYPSLPLFVWGEDDWEEFRENFCPTCLASLQATNRAKRQEFWDDLPKMYGLPPWEELEKMKVAAIGKFWFPSEV